ncbi:hypothetical protein GBA65_14115 [Rubrobacter marinus]|uniref:Uncharacterized protein n=1 Tax=Rubrobacter marinus TaxID=2653852 RepID=A0A6G8PZ18_9ACTN|nr:hypothetical protein [Rubrobacter marinus]QIN79461.1 hypothetical protein GBA65_14115 [Rubrobacter marinus]
MGLFGRRESKTCWVRSSTDDPCGRPATVEILGVPFCESCAQEYEEYAAIGTLTDPVPESELLRLRETSLVESLRRLRRERASRVGPRGASPRGHKV